MKGRNEEASAPTHRVNDRIRISPVLVIGHDGQKLGVMETRDALAAARSEGLDLVEVVPNQRPPVCRIMDYGKFRYEQTKKSKNSSRQAAMKEVRLRPATDVADRERAIAKARSFLEKGHSVQLTMLFRGRENANKSVGMRAMSDMAASLGDAGRVDSPPLSAGRRATLVIVPNKPK